MTRWVSAASASAMLMALGCADVDEGATPIGEVVQTIPNCEYHDLELEYRYCDEQHMALVVEHHASWHACPVHYTVGLFEADPTNSLPPAGWSEMTQAYFSNATEADWQTWIYAQIPCALVEYAEVPVEIE